MCTFNKSWTPLTRAAKFKMAELLPLKVHLFTSVGIPKHHIYSLFLSWIKQGSYRMEKTKFPDISLTQIQISLTKTIGDRQNIFSPKLLFTIALIPVIWEYFMFYKDISPSKNKRQLRRQRAPNPTVFFQTEEFGSCQNSSA